MELEVPVEVVVRVVTIAQRGMVAVLVRTERVVGADLAHALSTTAPRTLVQDLPVRRSLVEPEAVLRRNINITDNHKEPLQMVEPEEEDILPGMVHILEVQEVVLATLEGIRTYWEADPELTEEKELGDSLF